MRRNAKKLPRTRSVAKCVGCGRYGMPLLGREREAGMEREGEDHGEDTEMKRKGNHERHEIHEKKITQEA
jgi:hypothetical protein